VALPGVGLSYCPPPLVMTVGSALPRHDMSSSCPHCGAAVEFAGRDARILTGTCTDCSGTFTIVQEASSGSDASGVVSPTGLPEGGPAGRSAPLPSSLNCSDCGSSLVLRSTSKATIEAECPECRSTLTYSLGGPSEAPERGRRPSFVRSGDEGRRPFSPASARPCRECGGPLRFSTAPDGTVTGECVACGNRFSLGPRRESGPVRGRWEDRGGGARGGGFSRYRGSRGPPSGGDRRGPPRYGGSSRPYKRRERPSDGDDAPDENRRRRRPRPE